MLHYKMEDLSMKKLIITLCVLICALLSLSFVSTKFLLNAKAEEEMFDCGYVPQCFEDVNTECPESSHFLSFCNCTCYEHSYDVPDCSQGYRVCTVKR